MGVPRHGEESVARVVLDGELREQGEGAGVPGAPPALSAVRGTFSIVAADLQAGEVGCAVQSKYFSVGSVVPWARAGVGAVATQAAGVAVYGARALDELAAGLDPEAALDRVLADDPERETRQLGIV